MASIAEIESKIKQILIQKLQVNPDTAKSINSTTPLLGRGIGLDSIETLTLVTSIEQEFGIQVPDEQFKASLFQDVGTLAAFVREKLGER